MDSQTQYPARLEIDYPEKLDKVTTFFRLIWIIPIAVILGLLLGAGEKTTIVLNQAGEVVERTRDAAGGLLGGLTAATALMIIFRQRYPRWWFDFALQLTRFQYRVRRVRDPAHRPLPVDRRGAVGAPGDRLPRR